MRASSNIDYHQIEKLYDKIVQNLNFRGLGISSPPGLLLPARAPFCSLLPLPWRRARFRPQPHLLSRRLRAPTLGSALPVLVLVFALVLTVW